MIFNLLWLKSNNRIHSIRWGLCIGKDLAEQREQCFFNTDCLFGNSISSTFAYYIDTFWPCLSVRTQCLKICSAEQLAQNVDSWEKNLYIINRKLPFKKIFFFFLLLEVHALSDEVGWTILLKFHILVNIQCCYLSLLSRCSP